MMKHEIRILAVFLAMIPLLTGAEDLQVQRRFSALMEAKALAGASWSCIAIEAETGKVLAAVNPERPLVPASNQKLVTMAAALLALGTDYRPSTRFHAGGPIVDGTLEGDLIVAGHGAIHFTARHRDDLGLEERQRLLDEQLSWLVYQLRRQGVSRIAGALRADCTAYTDMVGNPHYPCAGPLTYNENTLDVEVREGRAYTLPRHLVGFRLHAESGNYTQRKLRHEGQLSDTILYNPRRTSVDYWRMDGMTAEAYYVAHLRHELTQRGLRMEERATGGDERHLLLELQGLSVAEMLPPIGSDSDNFRAEMLYLNLTSELTGKANYTNGQEAVAQALGRGGLELPSLVAADGSGLSRANRISASDLARLMRHMHGSPHRELFYGSLARAGETGTLATHLGDPRLRGNLVGKTGTLNGVRALSGRLTISDGREILLVFLCNDLKDADAFWQAVEQATLLFGR